MRIIFERSNDLIIKYYDNVSSIKNDWIKLQDESSEKSIFSLYDWACAMEKSLESGDQVRIVAVFEKDVIFGIFPLVIRNLTVSGFVKFKILSHLFYKCTDHCNAIIRDERKKQTLKYLVKGVEGFLCDVDIVKIDNICTMYHSSRLLIKIISRNRRLCFNFVNVVNPVLNFNEDSSIDAKYIKDSRRRLAQLKAKYLVDIQVSTKFSVEIYNKLIDFHRLRHNGSGFSSIDYQNFYAQILMSDSFVEKVDFSYVAIDGEIAAVHFGFKYDGKIYYYVPAYDAKFSSLGVGQILLLSIYDKYKDEGYRTLDMLRGAEEYKFNWLTDEFYNVTFVCPGRRSIINSCSVILFSVYKTLKRVFYG